jgi:hypothetical protein
MPKIKSLFHENLTFERRVEKVITFSNREPDILANEARDYVLTDNLSSEYDKLLNCFDDAQSGSGAPECCTWLSGFYGSGKSSFAKYFGLSFDSQSTTGDKPFYESFSDRFESKPLQQRMKTLAKKYDVAVFLLDLAAQGVANANNTPISTLLFDQVCAWAGYASDRKIGDLLSMLELDGKLDEFKQKVEELAKGHSFEKLSGFPSALTNVCTALAHEYYPHIWTAPDSFATAQHISNVNEQDRLKQMLDLVEKKAGTQRILFVVDEVGHFLRNNEDLINNLDGLAKNLKEIGQGRAWLIATAQQTIPKTGPLFGLQDRFPIKIDLRASDIREITHKRLLRKSASGKTELDTLFKESGQKLIQCTRLTSCDTYPTLDEESFVDFYPLLPQQFELLINAISALAKMHGGVGLRSAIRCVEDILLNQRASGVSLVDEPTGVLITSADIYDTLETDIISAAREITLQVDAISAAHGNGSLEHQVAKTIAVLQQIDGFPASRANIAALLHPAADAQPALDKVNTAIDALLIDSQVPIGETDDSLSFLSKLVSQVEKERANIPVTSTSRETVQSGILAELFARPPKCVLEGSKTIDCGISLFDGHREQQIVGRDKDIRFLIRFTAESRLNETKQELSHESLSSQNKAKIYLAAARPSAIDSALEEVYKADEIVRMHRNDADQEVQRYLEGQRQLVTQKRMEIQQTLREALSAGWFVFQGQAIALETLGNTLEDASKSKLAQVAESVFHHYSKAAINVKANVAEAFLKTSDIIQITSDRDPLGVVISQGSDTEINQQHPALVCISEFLDKHPNPDGKRILDEFANPPYGWTRDTTRYLLAALFYSQKIKLKASGVELTVTGPQAYEVFKTNSSFNKVTVNPNLQEIPANVRQAAAQRLSELTGEMVIPLPQKIAEVAAKCLPQFQGEMHGLPLQLQSMGVDTERITRLERSLTEALGGDGAEATNLFGVEESEIYHDLKWARALKTALDSGAKDILDEITSMKHHVSSLTGQAGLADLASEWDAQAGMTLESIRDGSFVEDLPALAKKVDDLKSLVTRHCDIYVNVQLDQVRAQVEGLLGSSDYLKLDPSLQAQMKEKAEQCLPVIDATPNAALLAQQKTLQALGELENIRANIQKKTAPKTQPVEIHENADSTKAESFNFPTSIRTAEDLDKLIARLEELKDILADGKEIKLIADN